MRFLRRKNERCAPEKMGKQRKSQPQARLLLATWRLLPATAATKRLDFCGEGRRLYGLCLASTPVTSSPASATASTASRAFQAFLMAIASPFTGQELNIMLALLAANEPVPAHESHTATRRREHVVYCFSQMVRFAHLAKIGAEPFRAAQWGLALGRVQELLGSVGGKHAWWAAYEPLLISQDWDAIMARTRAYMELLGLPQPEEAFINKH